MFTWDFGISLVSSKNVASEILYRLPWTILLMGGSGVIAIVVGVALGVVVAHRRGSKFDIGMLATALVTGSLPVFWMGMIFILIFTLKLNWFPSDHAWDLNWGNTVPWPQSLSTSAMQVGNGVMATYQINASGTIELLSGYASHAFMPLLTLSVFQFGGYVLLVRATMLESLTEDYIITARAKGVTERSVLFRHALKNASLPLITAVALHFGFMLSGAIITETVFSWPGLGYWIFQSVGLSDYFNMQAIFYIVSLCVIIANLIADLLYGVVDPRIKYG
jgi:peptide/nickel transport system permease protein